MADFDELDELLGIDMTDPREILARDLVDADHQLLEDLVNLRKNVVKMTAAQVAEDIGRHPSVITTFEKAAADPHLSTIRRYALAIGARITHKVELVNKPQASARVTDTAREAAEIMVSTPGSGSSPGVDASWSSTSGHKISGRRASDVDRHQVTQWLVAPDGTTEFSNSSGTGRAATQ